MARGRIIKPEFWTDGAMVSLSMPARLFYIGLWNFAQCDAGHLPDDPRGLKLKVFPGDQIDAGELVDELLESGRLARITLGDGRSFLHICRFSDHQKTDSRWTPRCPVCQAHSETRTNSPEFGSTHLNTPKPSVEGKGEEGIREEGSAPAGAEPPLYCLNHPNGAAGPCGQCGDARKTHQRWERAERNKTPHVPRADTVGFCSLLGHEEYPSTAAEPCTKCAREAADAAEERMAS